MKPNANKLVAMSLGLVVACGTRWVHAGTEAMSVEDSIDVTAARPTVISVYRAPPLIRLPSRSARTANDPAFAQCLPDLYCALAPAYAPPPAHADDKVGAP
ncbi:hypothetical protein BZM26_21315 [Paraburkholderia strydomiana]|nr:hypothetical protein BZM26_21315 [Paraburkholderia strydomiana]